MERRDPGADAAEREWRPGFFGPLLLLVLGGLCVFFWLREEPRPGPAPEPLPVLGTIPAFRVTDQSGRTLALESLLGRVWVADFIFTSCPAACPPMTRSMARLQEEVLKDAALVGRVRFVSFSVDPQRDTPEVLREFASGYGADFSLWSFATGVGDQTARLSQEGFYLAAKDTQSGGGIPTHSDRFGLVDARGRLRGHYQPLRDPAELDRLLADLRRLVREIDVAPAPTPGGAP